MTSRLPALVVGGGPAALLVCMGSRGEAAGIGRG